MTKSTGKASDPEWRRARARKGGEASKAARAKERETRGERFETKGIAYTTGWNDGYSVGYAAGRRGARRATHV